MPEVAESSPLRVECFLLCDHARVDNGKLYILGGGWDRIFPKELPTLFEFSIAIKIVVPADYPLDINLTLHLLDESDQEASPLDIELRALLVSGPPPDLTPKDHPLFFPIAMGLELVRPGTFRVILRDGSVTLAETSLAIEEPRDPLVMPGDSLQETLPAEAASS